jgi:hypothetical protein
MSITSVVVGSAPDQDRPSTTRTLTSGRSRLVAPWTSRLARKRCVRMRKPAKGSSSSRPSTSPGGWARIQVRWINVAERLLVTAMQTSAGDHLDQALDGDLRLFTPS